MMVAWKIQKIEFGSIDRATQISIPTTMHGTPDCNDICSKDASNITLSSLQLHCPNYDTDNVGTFDCNSGCLQGSQEKNTWHF